MLKALCLHNDISVSAFSRGRIHGTLHALDRLHGSIVTLVGIERPHTSRKNQCGTDQDGSVIPVDGVSSLILARRKECRV